MSLQQSREATGAFSFIAGEVPAHKPNKLVVEFIPPLTQLEQDALTFRRGKTWERRIINLGSRILDKDLIPAYFSNNRDNLSDQADRAEWEVHPVRVPIGNYEPRPTGDETGSIEFDSHSETATEVAREKVARHIALALPHRSEA